ncbi:MAG: ABC transporter ATP-binding protein [Deltaproteobacteria bacterium]
MAATVSVRGLEKSYPLGNDKIEVLRGLDLEVSPSELVAVMGPSGVGKSTLLNCIAGLDGADAGVVEVLGRDLAAMNDNDRTLARRRAIGIIYQFFNLVPNLDVQENVVLPYLIDGEAPDPSAVQTALERVGMRHRAKHLPSQLSGGEMQLVSIARAIARAPRLILADEPTGNVNVATGKRIMTLLSEVLKETGSAMLLVTHNPDDAARADRVVFLTDGAIDASTSLVGDEVSVSAIHTQLEKLGI